jgi:hypothetical protein
VIAESVTETETGSVAASVTGEKLGLLPALEPLLGSMLCSARYDLTALACKSAASTYGLCTRLVAAFVSLPPLLQAR